MRKRIIILLLAAVTVTGALWYYCLFTPYNYVTAKRDIRNGKVNFISFGLPAIMPNQARIDSLREKYGVKYMNIGCVITEDAIRGIAFYNKIVESFLAKRNGENWKEKYLKELADLRNEK
jgi:hypothetical protein